MSQAVTAIFGGTFDPIHHGHLGMAAAVIAAKAAQQITFMPARIPPHKRGRKLSSADDRLAMVRLAIADQPQFAVSDWELRQDHVSYTWHTALHFSAGWGDRLRLLIGMDSLTDLPNWYRAAELVENFRFIVYRRPGSAPPPTADLVRSFGESGAANLLAAIVDGPSFAVSSTEIRRRCASGDSVATVLPPAVATYVAANHLYQKSEIS